MPWSKHTIRADPPRRRPRCALSSRMGISTVSLAQAAARDATLATLSDVATIVIAAAMLILVLVAISVFVRLSRLLGEMKGVAKDNIGPVSDRAKLISDNLEFITQTLRNDVERLNSSVRALSDRLHQASDRMEERIEDFNALMEVVQGEAEDIFLDTASTVRGVRAGARQMASPRESDEVTPPAPATDHGTRKVDEFDLPLDDEVPDADAGADEPTYTEA